MRGQTGSPRRSSLRGTTGAASTTTSRPPSVDMLRLRPCASPGLVISPLTPRRGFIDHQTLKLRRLRHSSSEDVFLGRPADRPGHRRASGLAPRTCERTRPILGSLAGTFDFAQKAAPAAGS
jgi:hypothetical protein